ncbi:hypothetical protein NIES4075_48150 [Tolypothrix sp. NIES-4075]|nr:hypothetical protein NIES4075_48150 [Tolypothrix sp. NIES-4075]
MREFQLLGLKLGYDVDKSTATVPRFIPNPL